MVTGLSDHVWRIQEVVAHFNGRLKADVSNPRVNITASDQVGFRRAARATWAGNAQGAKTVVDSEMLA
jgi:hypothetical protein